MVKQKTCIVCKVPFTPSNSLQRVCWYRDDAKTNCASVYAREQRLKSQAKENKIKLGLIKHKSVLLSELQVIFNKYIRLRDNNQPCISCSRLLVDKFDAGHCFSVGSYPNLRFNEDNVHGQCVFCNRHNHGNHAEYLINLPSRIGEEKFKNLLNNRKNSLHLSKEEVEELKVTYKLKIKSLE